MMLLGRGGGKTKSAAEWSSKKAILGAKTRGAVLAPTFADVRDTCFEGDSGLIRILNEFGVLENYNRSNAEIFLKNGSRIKGFSAEEPDRLRGPQFHWAWCDEFAAFNNPDAWDQLQFGLRLGEHPQVMITTTPRPTKLVKDVMKREGVIVVRGSTFDNAANLAPSALAELLAKYDGTRLGRQELYGEIVDSVEGALFNRDNLEANRITLADLPPLIRIVVAIDPAVTSGEDSDETGIVVAGVTSDQHYYILEDLTCRETPDAWARIAVDAYHRHKADRIVAETNNGGDMIEHLIRQVDSTVSYKKVTATRGKIVRAEPIASLAEQNRFHLVGGFPVLEDQLCNYTIASKDSPNNFDAAIWSVTDLMEGASSILGLAGLAQFCPSCRMPVSKTATVCPHCQTKLGE